MEKGSSFGKMEKFIKECFLMEKCTVKARFSLKIEQIFLENGRMVKILKFTKLILLQNEYIS